MIPGIIFRPLVATVVFAAMAGLKPGATELASLKSGTTPVRPVARVAPGFSPASTSAQQPDLSKQKVPIVSVVGCAHRADGGRWMLAKAGAETSSQAAYSSKEEIEKARSAPLGSGSYRLIGTAEFVSSDELLDEQRKAITRVPNATGQLRHGHKVLVKGLLIAAPGEKRLNLLSVQRLADSCQ